MIIKECIPTRVIIAIQFFMACFITYMLRVNFSVNIVAMVVQKPKPPSATECATINGTIGLNPNYGPRYEWDNQLQGLILGAYFWGYIPVCLISGYLAERFSPTKIIGISTFVSAALSAFTPIAVSIHYSLLIAVRFILGAAAGVVYPCLQTMIAKWSPPKEKGRFSGTLMGGTFGTVMTWSCVGFIIEMMGWVWAFYIPAIFTALWGLMWFYCVFDTPEDHKRISLDERDYIIKEIGGNVSKKKLKAPYCKILISVPFWALAMLHIGNLWGLYFLLTVGPKFLSEILGFNLRNSGILSSAPYLARLILGFVFGYFGDVLRKREFVSLTCLRKLFCIFSHIIPGLLLLCMLLTGCDHTWAVILLTISLGINGASTVTNLQNAQDLAPNFAGSLYGFINALGSVTGILSPALTGQITQNNNNIGRWHICFVIGAAIYIISAIIFFIFGSGEEQEWNQETEEEKKKEHLEGKVNEGFTPA